MNGWASVWYEGYNEWMHIFGWEASSKTLNLKTESKVEGQSINLLGSDDVQRMELTHDRV
jgi:hypothetical protein